MKKAGKKIDISLTKKEKRLGLTKKYTIGLGIIMVLFMTFIGVLVSRLTAKEFSALTDRQITLETKSAEAKIDGYFNSFYPVLKGITQDDRVKQFLESVDYSGGAYYDEQPALYNTMINLLADAYDVLPNGVSNVYIGIDGAGGDIFIDNAGWLPPVGYKVSERSWYKAAKGTSTYTTTASYVDEETGDLVVTIVVPYTRNSQVIGAVCADVNLKNLQGQLADIKIGKTGSLVVFDADDKVVFHYDDTNIGVDLADAGYSQNMMQLIADKKSEQAVVYERNKAVRHGTLIFIPSCEWKILGQIPDEEYQLARKGIVGKLSLVTGSASLCMIIVVLISVSNIVKPIKVLDEVTQKLASGNLDVAITVKSNDELGDLGRSIGALVARLKNYIVYIDEVSEILKKMGSGDFVFRLEHDYVGEFEKLKDAMIKIQRTLSHAMLKISDAATQVDISSDNMADGAQALAQGATEQASTVEELAAAVQDLDTQSNREVSRASLISKNVEHIGTEVVSCNEKMQKMLHAMDNISEHSEHIEKIVKTVEDIAFQTNLLALNAAVEAARAGAAGKGFAVVADEVRNLAGKSSDAAKSITDLIKSTISAVQGGVSIADDTAQALDDVSKNMTSVVSDIESIISHINGESESISSIAVGIDQISAVIQTNSATSQESAATAQELASQVAIMKQMIDKFRLNEDFRD